MNNTIRDHGPSIARFSPGRAAVEGYRQERRARAWRIVGYIAAVALLLFLAGLVDHAAATVERPDQFPPGPVCPFGNATQRTCF